MTDTLPGLQRLAQAGSLRTAKAGSPEFFLTLWPQPLETPGDFLARLGRTLQGAQILRMEILGGSALDASWSDSLAPEVPRLWFQGTGSFPLAGVHLWAIADPAVKTLYCDSLPVGRSFQEGPLEHRIFSNLYDLQARRPEAAQFLAFWEKLETLLRENSWDLTHLARTWLYADRITSWYGELNRVRNELFTHRELFSRRLPASTGIGGANEHKTALLAGAWAVSRPEETLREIHSARQGPATAYRSAFARAMEIRGPRHRRLLISGTASIAPDGSTIELGSFGGQVAKTLEVIDALLESGQMTWQDITRMTGYFKDLREAHHLIRELQRRGSGPWPLILMQADVCRDNLLFELELDALR